MHFRGVESLLNARIGLDPATVGPGLVRGAVRRRLLALGLQGEAADVYLGLIRDSAEEFQALVDEVVTTETWFFRDVEPFRVVAAQALSYTFPGPVTRPFRVLSAPCATGEEPYSVAIALLEAGLLPRQFQIDAIDISRAAIQVARAGVYSRNAFRNKDARFLGRYFREDLGSFRIDPEVACLVHFAEANVLDPRLPTGGSPYDALFCRNVLIYLDESARARLVENLDRWLAPGGRLYVGHADRLGLLETRFRPLGIRGCFAFERKPKDSAVRTERPSPLPASARIPRIERFLGENPEPLPTPPPCLPPAREPSRLERATSLSDLGRYEEAADLCDREILERGPSAPAFFRLGMIRQAQGNLAAAEAAFQKASYLDGDHEETLLALALLAQRRGDHLNAERYRGRAERAFRETKPR